LKKENTRYYTNMENIILVDTDDRQIGIGEKMEVHEQGLLHRAFSIFIFDSLWRVLLQRRALEKYHSWWLWTNTCCSHPRDGESLEGAIHRRLMEEMGFDTELTKKTELIYHAVLDKWLTEHEYLHVYKGYFSYNPNPNPEEVMEWKWIYPDELLRDIQSHPMNYTEWFKIILWEHFREIF